MSQENRPELDIPNLKRASSPTGTIIQGDAFKLASLIEQTVDIILTSPPYWGLRDYLIEDQFGIEDNAEDYIQRLTTICNDLQEILSDDGSLWLNIGDTYNGNTIIRQTAQNVEKTGNAYEDQLAKNRDETEVKRRSASQFGLSRQNKLLIPERVAMALQKSGWILRDRIIWKKKNPKPEGRVNSRLTQSHETILRFVKNESHTFYRDRVNNGTDVWTIATEKNSDHPAPMPQEIARRCISLTTDENDTVLDPFCGSGTVCSKAKTMGRNYLGIELNPAFATMAETKTEETQSNSQGLNKWIK